MNALGMLNASRLDGPTIRSSASRQRPVRGEWDGFAAVADEGEDQQRRRVGAEIAATRVTERDQGRAIDERRGAPTARRSPNDPSPTSRTQQGGSWPLSGQIGTGTGPHHLSHLPVSAQSINRVTAVKLRTLNDLTPHTPRLNTGHSAETMRADCSDTGYCMPSDTRLYAETVHTHSGQTAVRQHMVNTLGKESGDDPEHDRLR